MIFLRADVTPKYGIGSWLAYLLAQRIMFCIAILANAGYWDFFHDGTTPGIVHATSVWKVLRNFIHWLFKLSETVK